MVADGTAGTIGTDNLAAWNTLLQAAATTKKPIYLPSNGGLIYDLVATHDNTTTAGCGIVDFPNLIIFGDGIGKTIIRMTSTRVQRGRVASISGNVITLVTAGDAAKWAPNTVIVKASPNIDGSSPRANGAFTIGVTAVNSGANTITVTDATQITGLTTNDYLFAGYTCSVISHNPKASDALTANYNLTMSGLELIGEYWGTTGNAATEAVSSMYNYNPAITASVTATQDVLFRDCKMHGFGGPIGINGGVNGGKPVLRVKIDNCDLQGGFHAVFMSTDVPWNGRALLIKDSWLHDTDCVGGFTSSTIGGSHICYINPGVDLVCDNVIMENWPNSKFGIQVWGTSSVVSRSLFTDCTFKSAYGFVGILTSERGMTRMVGCNFECPVAVNVRSSTTAVGCTHKPNIIGGYTFQSYDDVQYGTHLVVDGLIVNLVNSLSSGGFGAVFNLSHPIHLSARGIEVIALDSSQSASSVPLAGASGYLLVAVDGSGGGWFEISDVNWTQALLAGSISRLAQIGGNCMGGRFSRVRWRGRSGSSDGVVQFNGKTSTDIVYFQDCDILSADATHASVGSAIYYSTSVPAGAIKGRGNKWNGMYHTVATAQNLRMSDDVGPDIASGTTITWNPDYDTASVTGTTAIATINVSATVASQLAYNGSTITLYAPSGWATTTAGNIQDVYTVAAGASLTLRYNAATSKWTRIGT
jgi:hypothetical protein